MAQPETFDNARVPIPLSRFMELMRVDSARDLVRRINRFMQEMELVRKPEPTKDNRLVQTFLSRLETDMLRHRIWGNLSDTDKMTLLEGVELYSMTKLYKRLFGRYREDQTRDALISSRLFALQFVTPAHLDIPSDVITNESMIPAMRELQKINAFKSPRDKLSCVLNCCQEIITLLQSSKQDTGADAFMPVLNYVVIKTQPIHLISNIEYIRRFRKKSRLVSYADYYFTQLCAAAYFIESADAGSFTDGRQEFLSSFLQQGLISWKQYEEALNEARSEDGSLPRSLSFISTGNVSERSQGDGEVGAGSSVDELRSLTDEQVSARTIDWSGFTGAAQLEKEGHAMVIQMSATGDLIARHPLMNVHTVELKVEVVDQLLAEYKSVVLSYEVLLEAVMQNDTSAVLRLITEYEIKAQWRSALPSQGQLLFKYPFLCSSFQDLSFRDVSRLLNDYKLHVLSCESLIAGVKRRIPQDQFADIHEEEFEIIATESIHQDPYEQQPPLITRLTGQGVNGRDRHTDSVSQSTIPVPEDSVSTSSGDEAPERPRNLIELNEEEYEFRKAAEVGHGSSDSVEEMTRRRRAISGAVSIGRVIPSKESVEVPWPKINVILVAIDQCVRVDLAFE